MADTWDGRLTEEERLKRHLRQFSLPLSPGPGNNDGKVRQADGTVVADCFGHEGRAEAFAATMNTLLRLQPVLKAMVAWGGAEEEWLDAIESRLSEKVRTTRGNEGRLRENMLDAIRIYLRGVSVSTEQAGGEEADS